MSVLFSAVSRSKYISVIRKTANQKVSFSPIVGMLQQERIFSQMILISMSLLLPYTINTQNRVPSSSLFVHSKSY